MDVELGKISSETFDRLIYPRLGARRPEVAVGPQHGVDVGIIEVGNMALAMTADPVFIVPEYGMERAAWFAIHILASDAVTSGLPPAFLSIDLNLPMEMTEAELQTMWEIIHCECRDMGAAIVCGHTGRYENCHYPMVGGATFIAMGSKDAYCSPRFIRPGDKVIITKGPAIEACGIFATMFPKYIARELGSAVAAEAEKVFYKMSVVSDAAEAVKAGVRDDGVSAMHDATECGIWGGVHELAHAADVGLLIDRDAIVVDPAVPPLCTLFGIDPYTSISEGTLIVVSRPHKAEEIVGRLNDTEIAASVCGEILPRDHGICVVENGRKRTLDHPKVDPFWKAFYDSLANHAALESGERA
jgi:hydrogenase maturation factor